MVRRRSAQDRQQAIVQYEPLLPRNPHACQSMITTMKKNFLIWPILVAVAFLIPSAASAEQDVTNWFTFSARVGLNISAKFKGVPPRLTPGGLTYNYDNGYVYPDAGTDFDGQTANWGYDKSTIYPAGQVSAGVAFPANTLLLSSR